MKIDKIKLSPRLIKLISLLIFPPIFCFSTGMAGNDMVISGEKAYDTLAPAVQISQEHVKQIFQAENIVLPEKGNADFVLEAKRLSKIKKAILTMSALLMLMQPGDRLIPGFSGHQLFPPGISRNISELQATREQLIAGDVTLESIPAKDLLLILRAQGWYRWDLVFDWHKGRNPGITKRKFFTLENAQMLSILREFNEQFSFELIEFDRSLLKKTLAEIKVIISSREFKETLLWAAENLDLQTADVPFLEIFTIITKEEKEKKIYLHTLKSPEFRVFCDFLEKMYNITPNNYLSQALDIYLSPPHLEQFVSGRITQSFSVLKQYFKPLGVEFDISYLLNIRILTALAESPLREKIDYEKTVKKWARQYVFLRSTYGVKIEDVSDFKSLVEVDKDKMESLSHPLSLTIWSYFKDKYPQRVAYETVSEFLGHSDVLSLRSSFYRQKDSLFWKLLYKIAGAFNLRKLELVDKYLEVWATDEMSPAEFKDFLMRYDSLLSLFNTNLGKLDFTSDYAGSYVFPSADNRNFRRFVDKLTARYPELKNRMSLGVMTHIIKAYGSQQDFWRLNDSIQRLRTRGMPEFKLEDVKTRIKIINLLEKKNFKAVVLPQENIFGKAAEYDLNFKQIYEQLQSPVTATLYDVLIKNWQLSSLGFDRFIEILLNPEERDFYLDKKNAEKFVKLKKQYRLISRIEDGKPVVLTALNDFYDKVGFLNNARLLIEAYDLEAQKKGKLWKEYFVEYFQKKGELVEGKVPLAWLQWFLCYKLIDVEKFLKAANILQKKYGFSKIEIVEFSNNISIFTIDYLLEDLEKPSMRPIYDELNAFFSRMYPGKGTKEKILLKALDISDNYTPETVFVLDKLARLGFDLKTNYRDYKPLKIAAMAAYSDKRFVHNLKDNNFLRFSEKIIKQFYGGAKDIRDLMKLSELYDSVAKDREKMSLLFSLRFKDVVSFIKTRFYIRQLHSSSFLTVIRIAEKFNRERMEGIINRLETLGERVTISDVLLLNEISPELEKMLFDRQAMIREIKDILTRKAFPRQKRDDLPITIWTEDGPKKIKPSSDYTERPAFERFSNLALLRLVLVEKALHNPQLAARLSEIGAKDMFDHTTEYGGIWDLRQDGTLWPNSVQSYSEKDDSYENLDDRRFINGVFSFHFHALPEVFLQKELKARNLSKQLVESFFVESYGSYFCRPDFLNRVQQAVKEERLSLLEEKALMTLYKQSAEAMTKDSGPSGSLYTGGDIRVVNRFEISDTVITRLGHPVKNGVMDTAKMRYNVDFYYVDKRNPEKPRLNILDLGEIIVPYVPHETISKINQAPGGKDKRVVPNSKGKVQNVKVPTLTLRHTIQPLSPHSTIESAV
ncbi:MAG: hypothetical protein L6416_10990 [Candidatus Omnitrophica bacterium]|nr:hypothetical protein [Candidatus Omnitrophota bacterium]